MTVRFVAALAAFVLCTGFTYDNGVPESVRTRFQSDLKFVESIRGAGASPLHRQIFGQVNGADYERFLTSRVKSVGLNDCGMAGAVACIMPFIDPSKMWISDYYVNSDYPQIARLMVVFHEARHTESVNGNWPHAQCPTPFEDSQGRTMKSIWTGMPLEGKPGCDTTPIGSYGSSVIFLKNIEASCASCSEKVRMDAGLYGNDQAQRIIAPEAFAALKTDLRLSQ